MYEIKPQPVKSFIEDKSIKLPRFQRKKTWKDDKNFLLAVSVFKGYPLGVTILNIEKEDNKSTKWLLDGRQRRSALTEMYDNPEKIYLWACKYIKFKNTDQPDVVINKFIEKIKEYIELDNDTEDKSDLEDHNESDLDINNDECIMVHNTDREDSVSSTLKNNGLQQLVRLIKLSHNKTTKGTKLTMSFDFSEFFEKLRYIEPNGELNCKKLKQTIRQYREFCNDKGFNFEKQESFISFYEYEGYSYQKQKNKELFNSHLVFMWDDVLERIKLFDELDNLFLSASIGLIEVKDITTTDAQKIFNIINTAGTTLTAAEILSARPSWNKKVENISQDVKDATKELYKKIDVENTDVIVRWDMAATLINRIKHKDYIVGKFVDDKTGFEKEVGMSFKILSGNFEGGITKEDVSKLSTDPQIDWSKDIDKYAYDLSTLFKLIYEKSFFKFLNSWNTNLRSLLSEAISLNFIFLMYKDWDSKGKSTTDHQARKVQKNAYILFDKMVYEYTARQWSGSSDSKIARNISNFNALQKDGMFIPIEQEKWNALIVDIIDNNKVNGERISQASMTPLLYYYYFLKEIFGPNGPDIQEIEVDHILSKTLFDNSAIDNKEILQDNLFNLALLPKKENISKNKKRLIEITDPWLKSQISKYSEIEEKDFAFYSNISNYSSLKEKRGNLFKEAFNKDRQQCLNN